jgi:hypothetical protein
MGEIIEFTGSVVKVAKGKSTEDGGRVIHRGFPPLLAIFCVACGGLASGESVDAGDAAVRTDALSEEAPHTEPDAAADSTTLDAPGCPLLACPPLATACAGPLPFPCPPTWNEATNDPALCGFGRVSFGGCKGIGYRALSVQPTLEDEYQYRFDSTGVLAGVVRIDSGTTTCLGGIPTFLFRPCGLSLACELVYKSCSDAATD